METYKLFMTEWRWNHETCLHTDFYPTEKLARQWEKKVCAKNGACFITKLVATPEYLDGAFVRVEP